MRRRAWRVDRARLADQVLWQEGTGKTQLTWLVALLDLEGAGERASYFMPLALAWEERDEERVRNLSTAALARIRQQANVGVMGDAFADEMFCRAVVGAMAARKEIAMSQGKLQFRPTAAFDRLAGRDFNTLPVERPRGSSSNTVVGIGERLMLKGYRRLRTGANPELDMGLYLTDVVHYPNCAPLAGALEYVGNDGETRLLAMLQGFVANQGDGWTHSLEYLQRHLEQYRTTPAGDAVPVNAHEAYLALIRVLALRTAELHRALAAPTKDAAFSPQPLTRADLDAYRQRAVDEANNTLGLLASSLEQVPAGGPRSRRCRARATGTGVGAHRGSVGANAAGLEDPHPWGLPPGSGAGDAKRFCHHRLRRRARTQLGAALRKHSPLRDVAGMLRSFSYVQHSALRYAAHNEAEAARLAPLARAWEVEVRAAFLAAYDAAARDAACMGPSRCRQAAGCWACSNWKSPVRIALRARQSSRVGRYSLQGVLDWGTA